MEPTMLAEWAWRQAEWDAVAALYAGYLRAAWWRQIRMGLLASIFFLSVGLILMIVVGSRAGAAGVLGLGIIPQAIISANWLFDRLIIPRVCKGQEPRIRLGLGGISLGNKTFLWHGFFRLIRADLVMSPDSGEPHTLMVRVSFGHGFGTVLVPVPRDKAEEAGRVASALNREAGFEPRRAA